MSNKPKSLRTALGWSLIQHWGARGISFFIFFILARLLSPGDFGLVALSAIIFAFTEIFVDQGFSDAVVQSHDESDQYLSTAFWVNIITAIALMIIVFLGADYIAALFKAQKLAIITRVLTVTFLLTALSSVQMALLRRKMDYRYLAIRTTLANLVSGVVSIAMAFSGMGVWSLVAQQIVFGIVSVIVVWKVGKFRPSFQFDSKSFGQLMRTGLKMCGTKTVDLLHTKAIDTLVGIYLGPIILGMYSIGTRLGLTLMQLLGTSVADVSLAHFSDLRRLEGDLAGAYMRILKRLSITSVPLFAFLALEAGPLVHLLFGHKWDQAAPVFSAFCTGCIVQVLIFFSASVVNALGRPGLQLAVSIVKLVLYVAGFYLAFSHGIAAVAWAMTGVTVLIVPPMYAVIMARLLRLSILDLVKALWPQYFCVLIAVVITALTDRYFISWSILALVVSTGTFFGTFAVFSLATDSELRMLGRRMFRVEA